MYFENQFQVNSMIENTNFFRKSLNKMKSLNIFTANLSVILSDEHWISLIQENYYA